MFGTTERVIEKAVPGQTTTQPKPTSAQAAAPAMARTPMGAMGGFGQAGNSSAPRTAPSLVGSTTALTRKPNLQRRTLIGGVS